MRISGTEVYEYRELSEEAKVIARENARRFLLDLTSREEVVDETVARLLHKNVWEFTKAGKIY